jgi:hypothetical protein
LLNPKARMLPAISATWASLWVRALRGDGISRSIGQYSSRSCVPLLALREAAPAALLSEGLLATDYPPP